MGNGQDEFDRLSHMQGYSTPKPDPTLLTTEQLMREIANLRGEVMLHIDAAGARLAGEIELTAERFEAMRRGLDERFISQNYAIEIASKAANNASAALEKLFDAKLDARWLTLNERYTSQKEAVEAAFDAAEKSVDAAMEAAERAVEKANQASEKRFESVNEFRAQAADLIATFVPRAEIDTMVGAMQDKITSMQSAVDKGFTGTEVRNTVSQEHWGYIVGGFGLLAMIVTLVISMMHMH